MKTEARESRGSWEFAIVLVTMRLVRMPSPVGSFGKIM